MTDLLRPGDHRAGDLFSDEAVLAAMIAVEEAWLDLLAGTGIAPATVAKRDLATYVGSGDVEALARESETSDPSAALVAELRDSLAGPEPDAAAWLGRGLAGQDVVDTALMLCARDAVAAVRGCLRAQVGVLAERVEANPSADGARWLTDVLDAYDDVAELVFPVQVGGADGTLAEVVELGADLEDPVATATGMSLDLATTLGLTPSTPWHGTRSTVTRIGDAAVRATGAWARIAADVEGEPAAAVRRTATAAPQLGATLHLAAADADGWRTEADTLRTLLRHTVVAAEQATELVEGLHPREEPLVGATSSLVEAPLARAAGVLANGALG